MTSLEGTVKFMAIRLSDCATFFSRNNISVRLMLVLEHAICTIFESTHCGWTGRTSVAGQSKSHRGPVGVREERAPSAELFARYIWCGVGYVLCQAEQFASHMGANCGLTWALEQPKRIVSDTIVVRPAPAITEYGVHDGGHANTARQAAEGRRFLGAKDGLFVSYLPGQ